MGMTVDLLYRLMAVLFGPEPTPIVIAKKLLVDQLVYSPFFSMPVSIIVFVWQAAGYSPRETLRTLSKRGFIRRYPPLLIMCWCFWVPVLVAVYALPVNLQFLLFLCTEAAWSLLLVHASHSGSLPEASPVD
jgi:hypothetical protein